MDDDPPTSPPTVAVRREWRTRTKIYVAFAALFAVIAVFGAGAGRWIVAAAALITAFALGASSLYSLTAAERMDDQLLDARQRPADER